jgi:pimeloyl-ACP methyl ester carboxylesterase
MSTQRPPDQYITVGSIKTRFWSQGDHGTPVVLIHGISGSADDWIENIHRVTGLAVQKPCHSLRSQYGDTI